MSTKTFVGFYLERIYANEVITVSAMDGADTFAGSGVFTSGVYGLIGLIPLVIKRQPTLATEVVVYELTANGKLAQIFGSLGETRCRWTEAKIVGFCRENLGKLLTDGYANFFECEGFIAYVFVADKDIGVDIFDPNHNKTWYADCKHRVFVLKKK